MSNQQDQLEETVAAICDLVAASPVVRVIHVVTESRPTYPELMCFRGLAQAHGLTLIVLGSGGFSIRSS